MTCLEIGMCVSALNSAIYDLQLDVGIKPEIVEKHFSVIRSNIRVSEILIPPCRQYLKYDIDSGTCVCVNYMYMTLNSAKAIKHILAL